MPAEWWKKSRTAVRFFRKKKTRKKLSIEKKEKKTKGKILKTIDCIVKYFLVKVFVITRTYMETIESMTFYIVLNSLSFFIKIAMFIKISTIC